MSTGRQLGDYLTTTRLNNRVRYVSNYIAEIILEMDL